MPSRRWTRPVKQRRYRRNGALNDALLCRDIRRTLLSTVNRRPRACTPGKSEAGLGTGQQERRAPLA